MKLEFFDGTTWNSVVTSVGITGSSGLSVLNSPVTTSGTISLTLGVELQALSGLNTPGLVTRKGTASYAPVTITGTSGQINVANGNGGLGNPLISLPATGVLPGSYTNLNATLDAYGRVTSASNGSSNGISSVGITGSTGLTISGSPLVSPGGTINLTLSNELQALSNLNAAGILIRTGAATYGSIMLMAGTGISIANPAGTTGNPVISLSSSGVIPGDYPIARVIVDTFGRVTFAGTVSPNLSTQTVGSLPLNRLADYPNNYSAVLRGNGTWGFPEVIVSFNNYALRPAVGAASTDHLILNHSGSPAARQSGLGAGLYSSVLYGGAAGKIAEFFYGSTQQAYVSISGSWIVSSDKNQKHSLRKKEGKNYLKRILDLPIYSYCMKRENMNSHQANQVSIGVMYQDVEKIFNGHALSKPRMHENFSCQDKNCLFCHPKTKGVCYSDIFLYHILAFKDFYEKEYVPLKKKVEEWEQIRHIH